MPNQIIIPLFVACELFVALTIVSLIVRASWKPLEADFPARQPNTASYGRKFQSFAIGLVNYGYSIHVVIDDECLHLRPIWLVSRFGLKPVSIPWEAIQPIKYAKSTRKTMRVKIRKQTITGPKWCFELIAASLHSTAPQ